MEPNMIPNLASSGSALEEDVCPARLSSSFDGLLGTSYNLGIGVGNIEVVEFSGMAVGMIGGIEDRVLEDKEMDVAGLDGMDGVIDEVMDEVDVLLVLFLPSLLLVD